MFECQIELKQTLAQKTSSGMIAASKRDGPVIILFFLEEVTKMLSMQFGALILVLSVVRSICNLNDSMYSLCIHQ